MRDSDIRTVMRQMLRSRFDNDSRFAEEMILATDRAPRIDMAVINGAMHGFEIKSDVDTLRRLQSQIDSYSAIFDYLTLIVALRYRTAAEDLLPEWWGLSVAQCDKDVTICPVRQPKRNGNIETDALLRLLRRPELERLLTTNGFCGNIRSLKCYEMDEYARTTIPQERIQEHVRLSLKRRKYWKAAQVRS